MRALLLACGPAAALLYAGMTAFVPRWWPGYSSASQAVSELSAIGAPTRPIWVPLGVVYTLLVIAFGWGVWRASNGRRAVRVAGATLIVSGVIGLGWPPMHQREVLAAGGGTLTDTLHLVWAAMTVTCMVVAITASAVAMGRAFRWYSVVTLVLLMLGGVLTSLDAPRVDAGLPTPWMGVWERLNIGVYLVWLVVSTWALWPHRAARAITTRA